MAKSLLLRMHGPEVYKKVSASLDAAASVKVLIDAPGDDTAFAWWVLGSLMDLPPDAKATLVVSRSPSKRLKAAADFMERLRLELQQRMGRSGEEGGVELIEN